MASEESIQRTALQAVKELYPDIVISVSLNGIKLNGDNSTKYKQVAELKKAHFLKGLPDVVLYLPDGKVLNLEYKKPKGGVQSKEQKDTEQKLLCLGHNYYIVKSLDDTMDAIERETTILYRTNAFINYKGPLSKDIVRKLYRLR